jgi:hypothetical protein
VEDYGDEHLDYRQGEVSRQRTFVPKPRDTSQPYGLHVSSIGKWLTRAVEWVMDEEEERTGKRPAKAKVARGLLQLGVYRYRDLGKLPTIGRMNKHE